MQNEFEVTAEEIAKYFGTTTDEQVKVIAEFEAWQLDEELPEDEKSYKKFIMEKGGDLEVRVLYENKHNLVILSRDSSMEVVIAIDKADFNQSKTIEL